MLLTKFRIAMLQICTCHIPVFMFNRNFFQYYSLKLETWIKLNKIDYENVYSIKFSKKGQIPYIELNGEQIADSNIIIPKLKVYKFHWISIVINNVASTYS